MTTAVGLYGLSGCPFHEHCTQRIEICLRVTPPLKEICGRQVSCHRGGIVPLLEVKGLQEPLDVSKKGREDEKPNRVRVVLNYARLPSDDDFLAVYPHQLK